MQKEDLLFPHCFVAIESTLQVSDTLKVIWKQVLVQTLHLLFKKFQFICPQMIYILYQVTVMKNYTSGDKEKSTCHVLSVSYEVEDSLNDYLGEYTYLICSLYHWLKVKDYMMLHENLKTFV